MAAVLFLGDLIMHSPRRISMAGSVRDVTAHLLDDAQPDALSQAQPQPVLHIVQSTTEVPAVAAASLAKPIGELNPGLNHCCFVRLECGKACQKVQQC